MKTQAPNGVVVTDENSPYVEAMEEQEWGFQNLNFGSTKTMMRATSHNVQMMP